MGGHPRRIQLDKDGPFFAVCCSCQTERVAEYRGNQLSYEPSGGLPNRADANRALRAMSVPRIPSFRGRNETMKNLRPGFVLERVPTQDSNGVPRDRVEAAATFAGQPWAGEVNYLGNEHNVHLFERPDTGALAKQRREGGQPLEAIEQHRSDK